MFSRLGLGHRTSAWDPLGLGASGALSRTLFQSLRPAGVAAFFWAKEGRSGGLRCPFRCWGLAYPFLAPLIYQTACFCVWSFGCSQLLFLFSLMRGGRERFVAIESKSFDFTIVGVRELCVNYREWEGEEVHTCFA